MTVPARIEQLRPALLFVCQCGHQLRDNIKRKSLACKHCQAEVSLEDRQSIELASHAFRELAESQNIETVLYGRTEYEIDEASLPTGLLPIIIGRAAQVSVTLFPDTPYFYNVSELESLDGGITSTDLCVTINKESKMNLKTALLILTHITSRLIKVSRIEDPDNTIICDLRLLSIADLTQEFKNA